MEKGIFQLQAPGQDPGLWWSSRVSCKLRESFLESCGRSSTQSVSQLVMTSSSEWAKAPLISSIPQPHSSYTKLPAPFIAPFTTKDSLLISLAMHLDKLDWNRDQSWIIRQGFTGSRSSAVYVTHLQHSTVLVALISRRLIWYNYYVIVI